MNGFTTSSDVEVVKPFTQIEQINNLKQNEYVFRTILRKNVSVGKKEEYCSQKKQVLIWFGSIFIFGTGV